MTRDLVAYSIREGWLVCRDAIATCIFALAVIGWAVALGGV